MTRKKETKGFTLIELMVVMAIIAVLTTLIIGAITVARNTARETANRSNARTYQLALEAYFSRNRLYPTIPGAGVSFSADSNDLVTVNTIGILGASNTVNLNSTGACANGGAWIYESTPTSYKIAILESDCSTETSINDRITNN